MAQISGHTCLSMERMNGGSVCVLPVLSQWQREAAESKCWDVREDTAPIHWNWLSGATLSTFIPLSCLYLCVQFSLLLPPLSLIISPHVTLLSLSLFLAPSRFLLLFSPPASPCMESWLQPLSSPPLSLYLPLLCLTLSPLLSFKWLCKLSNLVADKTINTILASPNIHRSALCVAVTHFALRPERCRVAE